MVFNNASSNQKRKERSDENGETPFPWTLTCCLKSRQFGTMQHFSRLMNNEPEILLLLLFARVHETQIVEQSHALLSNSWS